MHDKVKSRTRRAIPAVHKILDSLGQIDLARPVVVDLVRRKLSEIRIKAEIPEFEKIVDLVRQSLERFRSSQLRPIINGTGIIIHTNLGRAPLSAEAAEAVRSVASAYSNLEYDLEKGDRGDRGSFVEQPLARLCGAESAMVVNNCAAALVLIVRHFSKHKPEIVISRGELVQIGGGFRVGEILEASGAKLREVGATNKTTLSDYSRGISKETALILKVHRSNFSMSGFVESPISAEIAVLARKKRVPFVEDLGSGAMIDTEQMGLYDHEPTPNEALKSGADLVCFSGDKLFGGPQAGIIAGKRRFISALKAEPLFRALRCDKLTFVALQATLDLHLRGASSEIPAVALLQIPKDQLRARAATMIDRLRGLPLQVNVGRGSAKVGGGALPRSNISSITIDILPRLLTVQQFAAELRHSSTPIIGYIANQRFKLDLRTIFPAQDEAVIDAIRDACFANA